MTGFNDPLVGGGGSLVYPSIHSPNFVSGVSGWSINKNGSAEFHNVTLTGGSLIVQGAGQGVFLYLPSPGLNNLIGSWATVAGTDAYGNTYPAGLSLGLPGTNQVQLIPSANLSFNVTASILGSIAAAATLSTTDSNQSLMGLVASAILGSGTSAKMSTIITTPFSTSASHATNGACIILEAENDGNSDTAVVTIGTVLSADGITITYSPVLTLTPFALIMYGGSTPITIKTFTSSTTWTAPAGVTSVKSECWACGGGGGGGASAGDNFGDSATVAGGSGGGGEYAAENTNTVVPTDVYTITIGSVGSAGSAGTPNGSPSTGGNGGAGGNTSFSGTSATTVTAHGGGGGGGGTAQLSPLTATGGSAGSAGTGSTNSVHHDGGTGTVGIAGDLGGASLFTATGSGGASSGGTAATGGSGAAGQYGTPSGNQFGGAGGTIAGGGNGGSGGGWNNSGVTTTAAGAGSVPGGGGGSGSSASQGSGSFAVCGAGATGGGGQVRLTYSASGSAPVIQLSVASASGTDQFGTAYSAGIHYTSADTNTYRAERQTIVAGSTTLINNTTPININGLTTSVGVGTYRVSGVINGIVAASGTTQGYGIRINGTSTATTTYLAVIQSGESAAAAPTWSSITSYNSAQSKSIGALALNTHVFWVIEGILIVSIGGSIQFTSAVLSANGDATMTIQASSYFDLMPV